MRIEEASHFTERSNIMISLAVVLKVIFLALVIGGIAAILIRYVVNKAPAPIPEWAKWLARIVIVLLALWIFLAAMGWLQYSPIR